MFGLLGVLNLAHGEFVMIGAYCAYFAQAQGWPYLAAIPVTLVVCGVLGWAVERALIRPLYERPFDTLLATWGLSLLLREIVEAIYGKGYKSLVVPVRRHGRVGRHRLSELSHAPDRAVGRGRRRRWSLWYLRSPTGTRIKAMVGNPDLARAVGIKVDQPGAQRLHRRHLPRRPGRRACWRRSRRCSRSWASTTSSRRSSCWWSAGSAASWAWSPASAIIGGVESIMSAVFDRTYGYFAVLVLAILFLWLRPRGIFARA